MNRKKLKLALGILSGRVNPESLSEEEFNLLGIASDRYHSNPSTTEVRDAAENIVLEALMEGDRNG